MMTTDSGLYDDALVTFFAEARDMRQQIEDALLVLENNADDQDTINALFRAVHTIKGSAGLFGMDRVVHFTHQVESVLDRVRDGDLTFDIALSDALLKSADVMATLLEQVEHNNEDPDYLENMDSDAAAMMGKLAQYLDGQPGSAALPLVKASTKPSVQGKSTDTWHISVRFGHDTFRSGFDPLSTVRYLASIGEITNILMITESIPDLDSLDPETCHLGFELNLRTCSSRTEIESAFDFVSEDCVVRILPPNPRAADYIELMHQLSDESRLGDLLVECGAVSRSAIEEALAIQQKHAAGSSMEQKLIGEILIEQKHVSAEVVDAALAKQKKGEHKTDEARFVRVSADKLDDLINLVGELVICGASASLIAKDLQQQQLIETTQQMSGLVEEIRNGTLGLRMVQIGESFARFRRVVRDTAAELGKEIKLDISGAETELDKAVVEKISDPLMHLVRNAIDHGIETPEVRLHAGKPAQGTLLLDAHHDSGHIVIRVTDDGKGLDGEKLLAKARERGLVGANQVLTEDEKLDLIFHPGFSTAEKVTNLSGRGVGMDVVKRNIEALRGSVNLESEVGKGTTIEIRLPLTLAIIDGFLVKIGRGSYVIPLHSVVECIDGKNNQLKTNGKWAGHIDLRGSVLPFLELRHVFNVKDAVADRRSIVVVRNGTSLAGMVVDQLLGEYQTVIKPLGKLFGKLHGISGSTVMGSGEVALILDVPALVKLATEREEKNEDVKVKKEGTTAELITAA
jgi:two-component system chemotaxis sensor kinase CheA